jgi:hypothetical protein
MPITLSGTTGITTPAIADTGTLSVTGVTTLTGGLNAALPVLSGGTGVTTKTGTGAVVLGTSPTLATPTFDSAQLPTVSGTAPLYMCRAWVNFNGTGTVAIRASGNVSSITDNGVGDYTVNFTTAMPDANYTASCVAMVAGANASVNASFATPYGNATYGNTYATTSIRVLSQDYVSAVKDCFAMNVSIFR